MDDFTGLLARDFGLKPQGKSAPMAPQTNSSAADFSSFASSYSYGNASSSPSGKKSDSLPVFDDLDRDGADLIFKDVFSEPKKYGSSESRSQPKPSAPAFDYDVMFKERRAPKSASMPVYDKPVYDDDIFEDIPELKSSSTSQSARFEDVFSSIEKQNSSPLDDLMGNLGKKETETKKTESEREEETGSSVFDDLIPGFGRSSSPSSSTSEVPRNTSSRTVPRSTSPVYENPPMHRDSKSDGNFESSDDVWLSVSEIPLFTQPTSAPPPSRPPPPRPSRSIKKQVNEPPLSTPTSYSHVVRTSARASANSPTASQKDDFSVGRNQTAPNGHPEPADSDVFSTAVASAAAMKDAMDKAEAKFRHAKEMREKENLKASRGKEGVQMENHDRELREKQMRLDREREEAQEREREEKERERLLARQAVERATREARERASTEARAKVQRAAVGKATEDRERAERAAVQRAHAEARERAAAGAREKAEKAAAEAREKEANARAQRAAVERAAAEARGRAAAQAKAKQQENNNDLDSFFNMGSRPSSAPRQRTNPPDPFNDSWNKGGSFESSKASSRVPSGATNMVDDLSSIFGGSASQSGGFQEVEGESEERRRARLERDQRSQARAAKALAEKNERDLQVQREQAERDRIGVTLDVEIKRWGAGKEGNLRALLSTLQYVLWPECGWQPVSLTDLITAASVKKFYRKATLCIHPDKVQQKGANLQQKYIAEKVFDLLKEAWNKFNSEELF